MDPKRVQPQPPQPHSNEYRQRRKFIPLLVSTLLVVGFIWPFVQQQERRLVSVPLNGEYIIARCRALNTRPGPPPDFHRRAQSDRFQRGTRATLIRNATIWTGLDDGNAVALGDVFLDAGIIQGVGDVSKLLREDVYDVLDAKGAWVTPGIVDMHSHVSIGSSPSLRGANDVNSIKGLVLPWLRALDGLNTHDDAFKLAVAGGLTTSLILPGSADAMGGQAFLIKLRPTQERSSSAMLLEPPYGINGTKVDYNIPPRWRYMKHACGENPARVYRGTRMDTVWSVRQAYDEARQIKLSQERYCEKALAGEWTGLGQFPEELRLEALVDILRGKFKVQTHCYEAVDIDAFVRLSNEFQFPVAAFHHAHESYLVPEVLKRGYEHPPASAIFASFSRYKREAYRHSEFAARILADNGLKVAMKSDHPGVVSRYLLHEAQQAHYHGLSANLALASVISTPAEVIGLDHRIGFVKPGYDADVVVWDSHPLALGATPIQVFIDGIPQLENAFVSAKSAVLQKAPKTPNFDRGIAETIKYEGLPPLDPVVQTSQSVLFRNVSSVWTKNGAGEVKVMAGANNVLVERGVIVWSGSDTQVAQENIGASLVVDLEGGSIAPALVSAGTTLGLQEISGESSATDGMVFDALSTNIPTILGDDTMIRAVDGLQFGTRDALLAYRAGVTSAIVAPSGSQFFHGLSVAFSLASAHKLQSGAILQETVAVHVSLSPSFSASISTQVALLRKFLLESDKDTEFGRVAQGLLRLVITVDSADIIATLLRLKSDLETESKKPLKISIIGGAEAHLLAKELAAADVGVILSPPRSFPYNWEHRRILPGPPLSSQSSAAYLAAHGVTVGLGPQGVQGRPEMGGWAAHNLRFDMAWVMLESNGTVSKQEALAMASSNIEKLLGVESQNAEWAVTKGGDLFSFEAKVIGVISATRGLVDLF